MFAIYNNGNVGFRSTVDNLYNLKNTNSPDNVELNPKDDTLYQEYSQEKKDKNNAVNAYKKMANLDTLEKVYHVEDIMSRDIICINKEASIQDAYDTLKEHKVSQIPIITFGKKIIGLINKKLILNFIIDDIDNGKYILEKKISDFTFQELITTDPISDIRRVAKVMIDFKLDAIPVVNKDDVLLGIVSKTDIIKAVSTIPKFQLWS